MTTRTDLGVVLVENSVLKSIAANAALEVEGVVGIWTEPWYRRWMPSRVSAVEVEISDQEIRLSLALTAEFGVNLSELAVRVQDRVRDRMEQMTQLIVVEVKVSIQDIKPKRS